MGGFLNRVEVLASSSGEGSLRLQQLGTGGTSISGLPDVLGDETAADEAGEESGLFHPWSVSGMYDMAFKLGWPRRCQLPDVSRTR